MTDWRTIVEVLLGAGVLGAFFNWLNNRRKPEVDRGTLEIARAKSDAEIYSTDLAGLRSIIATLNEEVSRLRGEVKEVRDRLDAVETERDKLRMERNEARDIARGLFNSLEQAAAAPPFRRPPWL